MIDRCAIKDNIKYTIIRTILIVNKDKWYEIKKNYTYDCLSNHLAIDFSSNKSIIEYFNKQINHYFSNWKFIYIYYLNHI